MAVYLDPLNDEPVADINSAQDRSSLNAQIANAVAHCTPPHVFGIHGEWGAGKTSFLCALEKRITGTCRRIDPKSKPAPAAEFKHVTVVWFEAWRYQNEPSPVVALLHEICSQLPLASKSKNCLNKLAYAGFRGMIDTIKEVTLEPSIAGSKVGSVKFDNPFAAIVKAGESYEKERFLTPLSTESIREALDHAISALLGGDKKSRILVIVDDLDRCEPASAYKLLEAIKIYLNIPSCLFLLGINQRHIDRALGDGLGTGALRGDVERRGAEYLEKLCTVIWKLPVNKRPTVELLLKEWLRPTRDNKIIDDYPIPEPLVSQIAQLARAFDCLPTNLRKLKAFCNSVRYLISDTSGKPANAGDDLAVPVNDADALIVAASIYTFHPRILARLQASVSFFDTLLTFSRTGCADSWMQDHEAFNCVTLPWATSKAGTSEEVFPNPDDGHVFRTQTLLNYAVGHGPEIQVPGYMPDRTRGGFYSRLRNYLQLPPAN